MSDRSWEVSQTWDKLGSQTEVGKLVRQGITSQTEVGKLIRHGISWDVRQKLGS